MRVDDRYSNITLNTSGAKVNLSVNTGLDLGGDTETFEELEEKVNQKELGEELLPVSDSVLA